MYGKAQGGALLSGGLCRPPTPTLRHLSLPDLKQVDTKKSYQTRNLPATAIAGPRSGGQSPCPKTPPGRKVPLKDYLDPYLPEFEQTCDSLKGNLLLFYNLCSWRPNTVYRKRSVETLDRGRVEGTWRNEDSSRCRGRGARSRRPRRGPGAVELASETGASSTRRRGRGVVDVASGTGRRRRGVGGGRRRGGPSSAMGRMSRSCSSKRMLLQATDFAMVFCL
ncbi:hypothetical protein QYE76_056831 [Lolium multiflorum]|uniref:Uncharacterized protein n=1 Tax=Lolium multiflorum TaxID=4521 RepID=A0AAD8T2V2_LOLMU|nr:hypothetical protein QYE76_056831 [Lolium multiflorum]